VSREGHLAVSVPPGLVASVCQAFKDNSELQLEMSDIPDYGRDLRTGNVLASSMGKVISLPIEEASDWVT